MKPGDHPDFFRFPPPPGRSRESRIVLDASGRFWNEGRLIEHQAMSAAFASWIRRHPDDGRYVLTNGYDWTYFTVEDAPFVVRHVEERGGNAILSLFDGTEEPLDPSGVFVSPDGVLYVRVKCGEFEARLSAPAQSAMVPFIGEDTAGEPCVELRGNQFPINSRERPRGAAAEAPPEAAG
jgi:hypothetical protein